MKTHILTLVALACLVQTQSTAQTVASGCYNDTEPPVAICDAHTVVSLTSDGTATLYATSVDDGSYDNCEIKEMKIARMTHGWCPPGVVDDTQFRPYVQFCCEDIGGPIWVILRVIDKAGNYNECMAEVIVQDKLPPSIHCPYDKTISCDYDFDPNELYDPYSPVFGAASAYDNCGLEQIYVNVHGNTSCGQGHFERVFTAVDWGGATSKCTQDVWVIDYDPFDKYDITWPWDYQTDGCHYVDTDPDALPYGYDRPRWENDDCSLIGAAYKDLTFQFVDGVCTKILRTWTVIDWCQYDANNPWTKGIWTHVQVIKLIDDNKPQFENCRDTTVLGLENTCKGRVKLDPQVWDICTPADQLNYEYKVDVDNNGSIDRIRVDRPKVNELLPLGTHRIMWFVDDGCGNVGTCSFLVTVVDGKAPTPVCYAQLSTVVMPVGGMVTLWAKDFDASSYDNCTPREKLKFSFSSNVLERSKQFNCDDVGVNMLQIYATDEAGNQGYCNVTVTLGDNEDVCMGMNGLTGNVSTFSGTAVAGATVALYKLMDDESMEMDRADESGMDGNYTSGFGTTNFDRMIGAEKASDALEGISTIDLVMLHHHITGIELITDPAMLYAADVDGSGHVGVSDLLILRDAFLSNGRSLNGLELDWTFYPANCEWSDGAFAPDCGMMVEIDKDDPPATAIDFLGIKKGDINGDMLTELTGHASPYTVMLTVEKSALGSRIHFVASDDMDVSAMQLSFKSKLFRNSNGMSVQGNMLADAELSYMQDTDRGGLNMMWLGAEESVIQAGSELFVLEVEHLIGENVEEVVSLKGEMKNRAFTFDLRPAALRFEWSDNDVDLVSDVESNAILDNSDETTLNTDRSFGSAEIVPNPMRDNATVYFESPIDGSVRFEVYSADLKMNVGETRDVVRGTNTFNVSSSDLPGPGVYYFRISNGKDVFSGKFISIN